MIPSLKTIALSLQKTDDPNTAQNHSPFDELERLSFGIMLDISFCKELYELVVCFNSNYDITCN